MSYVDRVLEIGDVVNEGIIEEIAPFPVYIDSKVIQFGEAVDFMNDKPIYPTLKKMHNGWTFSGLCYMGGEDPKNKVHL
jgi:hypothetical protein